MKGHSAIAHLQPSQAPARAHESVLRSAWRRLARWHELSRQRRMLASLPDGALKDLGLSRADIHEESHRPFWDDPMKK